jgi:hypothetical protein
MKKLTIILLAAMVISACKKEETPTPTPAPKVERTVNIICVGGAKIHIDGRVEFANRMYEEKTYKGNTMIIEAFGNPRKLFTLKIRQGADSVEYRATDYITVKYTVK